MAKMLHTRHLLGRYFQNYFNNKIMRTCDYCNVSIEHRRKTARFCSDYCRLKAYREKKGGSYTKQEEAFKMPKNIKSFTCCESGQFYSPVGQWGDILICDNCGTVWNRVETIGQKDW